MARKTLLGAKLRRLRQDRGLTQAQMAGELGISPSYLNLIEHNERPVTVGLLLKLGKAFDVDLQALSDDDERKLVVALREVFADGALAQHDIKQDEVQELVAASPRAARAVVDLYRAFRGAREDAQALVLSTGTGRRITLPTEEARDFFHDRTNHFPTIEDAAEKLWRDAALDPDDLDRGLKAELARRGITVAVDDDGEGSLRRYDSSTKRLVLSDLLGRAGRVFHMAYHLGLGDAAPAIDAILAEAKLASKETETLCRVGLVNYFAGAVLMPYAPFLAAAKAARYDIDVLGRKFEASFEQVCHRLSTLQRPGAKGVPFYLVRVDIAGNVSKRFSAAGFHFSRFGGSCPRWIVFDAFRTPGLIRTQLARLPDGAAFFCIARTVAKDSAGWHAPASQLALGLGCDVAHAHELVYADGLDLARTDAATEIGVGCRLCERANCRQRAFPPLQHRLMLDEKVKGTSAYPFKAPG